MPTTPEADMRQQLRDLDGTPPATPASRREIIDPTALTRRRRAQSKRNRKEQQKALDDFEPMSQETINRLSR